MIAPEYWIWLQTALGAGRRVEELLAYFGDAKSMFDAGRTEWLLSGCVTARAADALARTSLRQSEEIVKTCSHEGWRVITWDSPSYPGRLAQIPCPPLVLYVWGDPAAMDQPFAVSMVGTRSVSRYGARVADELSFRLAQAGAVVVSGGAMGVDSICHLGALRAGGQTVAVLGCGLGADYLRENAAMRERISRQGAVVTEFPPYEKPTRRSFPIRNRIIAGLGLGTVVVEAGIRSGSLITAGAALEQGRDVFAVPGNITDAEFAGANALIRDGAKAVFDVRDILDAYGDLVDEAAKAGAARYDPALPDETRAQLERGQRRQSGKKTPAEKKKRTASETKREEKTEETPTRTRKTLPDGVSANAANVYARLSGDAKSPDELQDETGLDTGALLAALTELELFGLAEAIPGRGYVLGA